MMTVLTSVPPLRGRQYVKDRKTPGLSMIGPANLLSKGSLYPKAPRSLGSLRERHGDSKQQRGLRSAVPYDRWCPVFDIERTMSTFAYPSASISTPKALCFREQESSAEVCSRCKATEALLEHTFELPRKYFRHLRMSRTIRKQFAHNSIMMSSSSWLILDLYGFHMYKGAL